MHAGPVISETIWVKVFFCPAVSLKGIASQIAIIRNAYGSGHGKSASYKGLQERHAKLAIGSSVTLVNFLWDSFVRMNKTNE